MNKLFSKISVGIMCFVICFGSVAGVAFATNSADSKQAPKKEKTNIESTQTKETYKDETVYVLAGAEGTVKKVIVSDWIKNALGTKSINDKTELKKIENVKGDESYTLNGENMTVWDAEGNDIYYQGDIEKELPVGLSVSYKLDGKSVKPQDILGKSGKVKIRFDYQNKQYETVKIDGKKEKIYVPFAMLTGMLLDSDKFSNVKVSNGKLLNDGDRTAVIGIALPGMQENLGLKKETIEIPDYVEITADVKDFNFGMTVTVATNELFNGLDTSKLDSIESLAKQTGKLKDGMKQLLDGSSALYNGLATLLKKSDELVDGVKELAKGAKAIKEGAATLDEGTGTLKTALSELSEGLDTLSGNNEALNGGAKQVFDTLLSTAAEQINAAGITVPELTVENYATVLESVIESLDETNVYNKALSEVTAAVEQNRPLIEAKVKAARNQIAEQVIPIATNYQMTKESYDMAVALKQIPEATITAIEAAIDNAVATEIENQVKKAISDNMASDEVKAKLAAASEGAKSVIKLKESLDSYNTFYLGLLSYTDGVSKAASGAGQINDKMPTLKDGTKSLKKGTATLYKGVLKLKNGTPALTSGVAQLKDGAMQLSNGLEKLNKDGIEKIVNLVSGDVKGVVTRFKATVDVSKNYRNFSGISDDMDGQVKFIYKTEEIE